MIKISDYRRKMLGLWRGKAIGGTLGMKAEGLHGPLFYTAFDPVPDRDLPNDDLELQLLWAVVLRELPEPVVDRRILAAAWLRHNFYPMDEYGIASRNLAAGIMPPHSGRIDNAFTDGLGAAIRSEIWACLAPGDPALAAQFATEDACIDHDGEGIYAARFLAALESAGFAETDLDRLLDAGLSQIPGDCAIASGVADVRRWVGRDGLDHEAVHRAILAKYGSPNFTDVKMNLPFIVAALLLSGGDFGRGILGAVNFGEDADCTAATVGAILGLLDPDGIPPAWSAPVGDRAALSRHVRLDHPPATLQELTALVADLAPRARLRDAAIADPAPELEVIAVRLETALLQAGSALSQARWEPFVQYGLNGSLPCARDGAKRRLLRGHFVLDAPQRLRLCFNTPSWLRFELDGKMLLSSKGAALTPSAHRTPGGQYADLELGAGRHDFLVSLNRSTAFQAEHRWAFGLAELPDLQWTNLLAGRPLAVAAGIFAG